MEPTSKKSGKAYRPIIGIFVLLLIARVTYKVVIRIQQSEEQTKIEEYHAQLQEKNRTESHAYSLDLNDAGVLFMKMDNEPYPLFYVSVLDSTILREESLVPLARRVIQNNNLGAKIELESDPYSSNKEAPAEVKYIFNQDFDHILAEKVFVIKKDHWNRLSYEERQ